MSSFQIRKRREEKKVITILVFTCFLIGTKLNYAFPHNEFFQKTNTIMLCRKQSNKEEKFSDSVGKIIQHFVNFS